MASHQQQKMDLFFVLTSKNVPESNNAQELSGKSNHQCDTEDLNENASLDANIHTQPGAATNIRRKAVLAELDDGKFEPTKEEDAGHNVEVEINHTVEAESEKEEDISAQMGKEKKVMNSSQLNSAEIDNVDSSEEDDSDTQDVEAEQDEWLPTEEGESSDDWSSEEEKDERQRRGKRRKLTHRGGSSEEEECIPRMTARQMVVFQNQQKQLQQQRLDEQVLAKEQQEAEEQQLHISQADRERLLAELKSNWEFVVVIHFVQFFQSLLHLPDLSPVELLEEFVNPMSRKISRLHIALLKKLNWNASIKDDNWTRMLGKACAIHAEDSLSDCDDDEGDEGDEGDESGEDDEEDENPYLLLSMSDYIAFSLQKRVRLLKLLCEWVLEESIDFRVRIKGLKPSDPYVQALHPSNFGEDADGNLYWKLVTEGTEDERCFLIQEVLDKSNHISTWDLVCDHTRESWENFVEQFGLLQQKKQSKSFMSRFGSAQKKQKALLQNIKAQIAFLEEQERLLEIKRKRMEKTGLESENIVEGRRQRRKVTYVNESSSESDSDAYI